MRRTTIIAILVLASTGLFAQTAMDLQSLKKESKTHFGIKAGLNYSNAKDATNLSSYKTGEGFMVGGFMTHGTTKKFGKGFRAEVIYTKQRMDVNRDGSEVKTFSEYISLPHLTTFNITKFLQLQAGGQVSYLISAQQDKGEKNISEMYNRVKYGFTAGVEIRPVAGLIIGGRYNIDATNSYKDGGMYTPFPFNLPTKGFKNGLYQFSIGYVF